MKSSAWQPFKRIEEEYRRQLLQLLDRYLALPTHATLGELVARLTRWQELDRVFHAYAETAAGRMVTNVLQQNSQMWRAAAREAGEGQRIFTAVSAELRGRVGRTVRAKVTENAGLIATLPQDLALQATRKVARLAQAGARSETIARELRGVWPRAYRARAALIARTETAKASTALTRARAEEIGSSWYVWRTSEDQRVRLSHRWMDGVLCPFADDPHPEVLAGERDEGAYAPGEIFNCRCSAEPLLRYDQVSWPARVYYGGAIRRMTLTKFRGLAVNQHAAIRSMSV